MKLAETRKILKDKLSKKLEKLIENYSLWQ